MNKVDTTEECQRRAWADAEAALNAANDGSAGGTGGPTEAIDEEARKQKREHTIKGLELFLKASLRRGRLAAWQFTDAECEELAEAYADVIIHMFPDTGLEGFMGWWDRMMEKYGPYLVAIYVTGKIAAPRIMNPDAYAEPEEEDPPGEGDDE